LPGGAGTLVYNHNAGSLGAHCPHHRPCRMNRALHANGSRQAPGRPVGQLIAWLRDAHNHASKALHVAARKGDGQAVTWQIAMHAEIGPVLSQDSMPFWHWKGPSEPGNETSPSVCPVSSEGPDSHIRHDVSII
jgi:hypothetical protein